MNNTNYPADTVLTDCITALICPLGEFYPNKDYGSRIRRSLAEPDKEKLLCYARQALSRMDGVFVKTAAWDGTNIIFTLMINDEERQASIPIEQNI